MPERAHGPSNQYDREHGRLVSKAISRTESSWNYGRNRAAPIAPTNVEGMENDSASRLRGEDRFHRTAQAPDAPSPPAQTESLELIEGTRRGLHLRSQRVRRQPDMCSRSRRRSVADTHSLRDAKSWAVTLG